MSKMDWPEIRFSGCDDGHILRRKDCLDWIERYGRYLQTHLGPSTRIRLYPYRYGCSSWLAIDAYNAENDSLAATILVTQGEMHLCAPRDNQMDLVLPGIVDALSLAATVHNYLQGRPEESDILWVSSSPFAEE